MEVKIIYKWTFPLISSRKHHMTRVLKLSFSLALRLTEPAQSHLSRKLPCFSKAETISIFQVVCAVQVYGVNSPEFYLLP